MLRLRCQSCAKSIGVNESLVGKKVKCPHCGEGIRVPAPGQEASPGGKAPPVKKVPPLARPTTDEPQTPTPVAPGISIRSAPRSRVVAAHSRRKSPLMAIAILAVPVGLAVAAVLAFLVIRDDETEPRAVADPAPASQVTPASPSTLPEPDAPQSFVETEETSVDAAVASQQHQPQPPKIQPIEDIAISADQVLLVSPVAEHSEASSISLKYRLGAGSPVDARIHPETGQISWRPQASDAGKEHEFVVVLSTGQPSEPDVMESFHVLVGPATNVLAEVVPKPSTDEPTVGRADARFQTPSPGDGPMTPPAIGLSQAQFADANAVFTDQEMEEIAELYQDRSLFNTKTYPALRTVFAERFARQHNREIRDALGPEYDAIMTWLDENAVIKEELFTAIDPDKDDIRRVLQIIMELKQAFPEQIAPYGNLAVAIAVTWDNPRAIYDYANHQRRAKASMPDGLVGAVDNFAYFLKTEQFMQGRGKWLPWEFLVHVVNHKTPLSERAWALQNYLPKRVLIGKCYKDVPYDNLMLETGSAEAKLNGHVYDLANLRAFGGVCAHQADFSSRVGKSLGVPAAYVAGESTYGDLHAWVMWVELKAVNPTSITFSLESNGRYRGDKYYVGTLRDPKSGDRTTDRQLELRLHTVGMDAIAKRQSDLVMAAYPHLVDKLSLEMYDQFSLINRVVDLCPGNERAWQMLAQMASEEIVKEKHHKQMTGILNRFFETFAHFPDFTWTIFDDLIAFEDRLKERIKLYERLVLLYQLAQRPDLACEARLRLSDLLIEDERQLEAVAGLAVTVYAFADDGRYVPRMLDRIELICQDVEGSTPHLLRFYNTFLPKIPQKRGDRPSKYCMKMYRRGIARFREHGEFAAAQLYENQLAQFAGAN